MQVWSTVKYPGVSFISVTDIVSRVVYTKYLCNFGRHFGDDSVYVIVPLESVPI